MHDTESGGGLGWKGPLRISQFHPPAVGVLLWLDQTAQSPSSLALGTARDGAAPASLGSLPSACTQMFVLESGFLRIFIYLTMLK